MSTDKKKIIQFIKEKADYPMKMKELAKALSIRNSEYATFRNSVKEMINRGDLVKLKKGRIGIASELNVKVGIISMTKSGFGFLIVEDEQDIFIPPTKLYTALDSDKVMIRLSHDREGRITGTVIKIIERAQRNIVGIFRVGSSFDCVVPDNKKLHRDIYIPSTKTSGAKDGQKVVAIITNWDDPYRNPEGKVTEVLGYPGHAGVDLKSIVKSYKLPEEFPSEVLSEAEKSAAMITEDEFENRLDLTKECIYTIDPIDAKDHDDAVSVEKTDFGYRLSVHIADVSYFVEEDTALDKEALKRGNSVYLPGTVIPMLPEILSNNVCSLKVNRKRLAHSVFIDFDTNGKMKSFNFADTIIKSRAKLSYEEVQDYFDNSKLTPGIKRVALNLQTARELANIITNRRFADGSLDFDLPESLIILNKEGEVIELGNKVRLESHRLVEEFMLVANKAVALFVFRHAQPFLFRVHDKPDLDKIKEFSILVKRLGYTFPVSKTMKPRHFSQFLDRIKNKPEADFINEIMLRSMKKAVYQRDNIGHFGLAFNHYTHFTSPIRRYADLLVHRMLRKMKNGRFPVKYSRRVVSVIDRVGEHCSLTERNAEAAEREAIKIKQMSFMSKHIGDEFDGVISGVTSYGFFVRFDKYGVEGLIRMSAIDDDYYNFDEKQFRIVGRRTGKVYQLGNKIKVGVLRVDKLKGEMDLFIIPTKKKKSNKKQKQKLRLKNEKHSKLRVSRKKKKGNRKVKR
jgi:ribonuclease R